MASLKQKALTSSFDDMKISQKCSSIRWRAEKVHQFQPKHYNSPTSCGHCGSMIVSLKWHQGLTCTECGMNAHKKCAPSALHYCMSKNPKLFHQTTVPDPEFKKEHSFALKTFDSPTFCNVCRAFLVGISNQGYSCSSCRFVAHKQCLTNAPENCTPLYFKEKRPDFPHFWVEGNLVGHCNVCQTSLSAITLLFGYRCFWCGAKSCGKCIVNCDLWQACCDLGIRSTAVIPPNAIATHDSPNVTDWRIYPDKMNPSATPIIVFINKKSGGQLGDWIIKRFNMLLNPVQVFDLAKGGPRPALEMLDKSNLERYIIVACGGDGTAAWVLQVLDELKPQKMPPVAVLPLGTGNDLSRTLGWGPGYRQEILSPILEAMLDGTEVALDRWNVEITNTEEEKKNQPVRFMNNYFSVGLDAKIALDFHLQREENPENFKNASINKLRYGLLSAGAIVKHPPDLSGLIKVLVDGKEIKLPYVEAVLILNVPSYSAGTTPWGTGNIEPPFKPLSCGDKLIEVIGITGTLHLAQLQAKTSTGIRLGQGNSVEIVFVSDEIIPVQLDGEPWPEKKAAVKITWHNQAKMIARNSKSKKLMKVFTAIAAEEDLPPKHLTNN